MADYRKTVGNVELVSLTDDHGAGPATVVFPASTMETWRAEYPELLDADKLIHPRYGSVAVRSDGRLIVVDTGGGPPTGALLDEMKRKGVDREAVDVVVTTHLHPDHVGWNLTDTRPTFPNARYLVPKKDYDYWTGPGVLEESPHVSDSVVPLDALGALDLIEGEHSLTSELTTVPTPGHTPGHVSIAIVSAGVHGFILGDVAHSPAQAHYTDWNPAFDVDPDLAQPTRHRIFDRLEEEGSLVSAGHFPEPGFGRFVRSGGRRRWQPE